MFPFLTIPEIFAVSSVVILVTAFFIYDLLRREKGDG